MILNKASFTSMFHLAGDKARRQADYQLCLCSGVQ
jgi:hypothetical protein